MDDSDTRLILALMVFTMLWATVGEWEKGAVTPGSESKGQAPSKITTEGRIIVGGFTAAVLLTLLAQAGPAGRKFAVGLAGIAAVTSMFVYGAPVWSLISGLVGAGPGGTPTVPTTPTQGTASTGLALSNLAG